MCDNLITKYCKNSSNPKCKCIKDYEEQENQSCHVPSCQKNDVFKTSYMLNERCTICDNIINESPEYESENIPISIGLSIASIVLIVIYIILSYTLLKNIVYKKYIIIGLIIILSGVNIYFTVNDYKEISNKFFCSIKK